MDRAAPLSAPCLPVCLPIPALRFFHKFFSAFIHTPAGGGQVYSPMPWESSRGPLPIVWSFFFFHASAWANLPGVVSTSLLCEMGFPVNTPIAEGD